MQLKTLITIILCFINFENFHVIATGITGDFVSHKFEVNTTIAYYQFAETYAELKDSVDSDRLFLLSGKEIVCKVKQVTDKFVFYSKPNTDTPEWVAKGEVQSIKYRSGKVVELSTYIPKKKEEKDWRSIKLTKHLRDVEGHIKIDNINVRFEAKDLKIHKSAITLERSAEIVVMKQAAILNADFVLITKVSHIRAYGDPPVIIMLGEAYRKR